jgi:hypothetical protein
MKTRIFQPPSVVTVSLESELSLPCVVRQHKAEPEIALCDFSEEAVKFSGLLLREILVRQIIISASVCDCVSLNYRVYAQCNDFP